MPRLSPLLSGRTHRQLAFLALVLLLMSLSCVRPRPRTSADDLSAVNLDELWKEPLDLPARDLLHGPGGPHLVPDPAVTYAFEKADTTGFSKGYEVRGPDGRRWNVKLGIEAQPEVAASRILWAIGYHQPVVYYVPEWSLSGRDAGVQQSSRFRFEDPAWKVDDDWSWYENDFVGTRPFQGLIVANLILNNWDWKTSNNKIIEYRKNGSRGRLYLVRDLGASLGKTSSPAWLNLPLIRMWKQGTRNNLADFESQGFIKHVSGDRVEFHYRGINQPLVDSVTRADVMWACRLMNRLTDRQWHDAFRAAGYSSADRERFVRKVKSKVAEGVALASGVAD